MSVRVRGLLSGRARGPLLVGLLAGAVFVVAGLAKFLNHDGELASFRTYGLPWPAAQVVFVGAVEILGGLLLLSGRLVRPAALALAATMLVAIVVSGFGQGEVIPSLTLAPVLLAAMVYLLTRPGRAGA